MKRSKRLVGLIALMALVNAPIAQSEAMNHPLDSGGFGYSESRRVCYIAPVFTIGIVFATIITVIMLTDSNNSHSHND